MMKNKSLFILTVTFVIILGIAIFLIRPVVSSILASYKDLSQTKENLKLIEEKKQILESLKSNQNLTKVADIAEKYIPKEEESGQLIIELTAIAQANNLRVDQTSIEKSKDTPTADSTDTNTTGKATPTPSSTTAGSTIKTVNFTEKLNGSYVDFINFLKALEASSRLILVKNISMQTKTEQGKPTSFDVQLSGSAYYKSKVDLEQNLTNIKITEETLNKFLNLKSYGQPINLPGESGFGRTNPFESY
ncbi:MAG: type II secretion system protein M [Patescibacteria group bacterium]|nr:type II secretion system protein M [Patescibacteria group bacterium]